MGSRGGGSGKQTEVSLKAPLTSGGYVPVYDMSPSGPAGVQNFNTILTSLNTVLDAGNLSDEHTGIDCSDYRSFMLCGNMAVTGTPTDIRFEVRFATNATTSLRYHYQNGFWGDVRWDDVAADGQDFALSGDVIGGGMSVFATMTTAAAGTFTLTNMKLMLKD